MTVFLRFLPLGAAGQGELWPPEQSAFILIYSSSLLPIHSLSFTEIIIYILQPSPAWEIWVWREEYYQN
jgi:hypothetical protein